MKALTYESELSILAIVAIAVATVLVPGLGPGARRYRHVLVMQASSPPPLNSGVPAEAMPSADAPPLLVQQESIVVRPPLTGAATACGEAAAFKRLRADQERRPPCPREDPADRGHE
ncbi:MAG TPA: hypothetical protein VFA45_08080 [Actinomycetes bacterium]|nr:hypothetical protein [Actinomycetes bacterium]